MSGPLLKSAMMATITTALILLASSLLSPPIWQGAAYAASKRSTGLDGTWVLVLARTDRSHALRPFFKVSVRSYPITFKRESAKRFTILWPTSQNPARTLVAQVRENKADLLKLRIRFERGTRLIWVRDVYSDNGVTMLRWSKNAFLVRFAKSSFGRAKGIDTMTPFEFCQGPARQLIDGARKELDIAKRLKNSNRYFSRYRLSRAATAGMFAGPAFERALGQSAEAFDEKTGKELLERLKYCAIFAYRTSSSELMASAVLRRPLKGTIKAFFGLRTGKSKHVPIALNRMASPSQVSGNVLFAREKIAQALPEIQSETDPAKRQELAERLLNQMMAMAAPSELQSLANDLERRVAANERKEAQAREEERLRTAPTPPDAKLVLEAARQYFMRNCSKSFLALKAAQKGNGNAILSTLLSKSAKPKNGSCQVDTFTHLLRIGVSRVMNVRCTGFADKVCSFNVFWSCNLRLNPKFGFSQNVRDFDPICPVISSVPVAMKGTFAQLNRLTWRAQTLDW